MNAPIYLSWDNFRTTILVRGQQRVHLVSASPLVEIFSDGDGNRIGIWIEVLSGTTIPPELAALQIIGSRILVRQGKLLLEVATAATSLQRQFYHFAVAVAERVLVGGLSAVDAVGRELRCFTDLLEEKSLLGIERQIGLLGELLFLEHLTTAKGVTAMNSWLGPSGEPHDFRLGTNEYEVKTTIATRRIHTIHGTEQLVASKDCSLFVVSILLGPPGASDGFSLAGKVEELFGLAATDVARARQFEQALEASGYQIADGVHYRREFSLRRPMAVIPVDDNFPSITRPAVQKMLGSMATRIESLQYDVHVDGLEHEEGSAAFSAAFPS